MRSKLFGILASMLLVLNLAACGNDTLALDQRFGPIANPVTLLVDFEDDATASDIAETEYELGVDLQPNSVMFSATKLMKVTIDRSEVEAAINKIKDDWDVDGVEVSQQYSIPENLNQDYGVFLGALQSYRARGGAEFDSPNDPQYGNQKWHFDMIGLEDAWKYSTGKGVIIAIIDTGITGPNSKSGLPQVPDIAPTKMVDPYNFVDDNNDPYDRNSHGTHVGSSVAEATNNDLGGVGIAFNASLMPLKVLSDRGSGSTEDIAEAIVWAADHGAHIGNMSLGGGGASPVIQRALDHAAESGMLMFCAAGNSSRPRIEYPAAQDGCLAISSVGPDAKLAPYSSHGEGGEGLFLASPGGNMMDFSPEEGGIWQSTVDRNDPYKWGMFPYQGTSMATPIAVGSAALVISALMENDGEYDLEDVKSILASTATDKGDKFRYGAGIVHVGRAVQAASSGNMLFGALSVFALACLVAYVASRRMSRRPKM